MRQVRARLRGLRVTQYEPGSPEREQDRKSKTTTPDNVLFSRGQRSKRSEKDLLTYNEKEVTEVTDVPKVETDRELMSCRLVLRAPHGLRRPSGSAPAGPLRGAYALR